jgi:predicted metal-dependent enzyme (double-stranded beta helix superfamily)
MMIPATRMTLGQARLGQLVTDIAGRPQQWLSLVRYTEGQRWYRRLARDDDHEVWLLSWLPGQGTGFHDHGGSAGAFAVARGTLQEWTAARGQPSPAAATMAQGTVRSFGSWYVHHVINASAEPAVSVHAYSPPLEYMRRFEFGPGGLLRITTERAGRWLPAGGSARSTRSWPRPGSDCGG